MTFGFYVIPMGQRIGYQFTFLFFVVVGSVVLFVPILLLMFRGEKVRRRFEGNESEVDLITVVGETSEK